jgi:hypothetical protein
MEIYFVIYEHDSYVFREEGEMIKPKDGGRLGERIVQIQKLIHFPEKVDGP